MSLLVRTTCDQCGDKGEIQAASVLTGEPVVFCSRCFRERCRIKGAPKVATATFKDGKFSFSFRC